MYAEWTQQETTTEYRQFRKLAEELNFASGGYWVDTQKPELRFRFYRKRKGQVEAYMVALKRLAPVLKAHPDGTFWFGVFEYTLSEGCSYRVHVHQGLSWAVLYAGIREEKIGPRPEVLPHIERCHYYE